ncbi:C-C chemokine receptor type 7 [Gasterosteus aculeatus]
MTCVSDLPHLLPAVLIWFITFKCSMCYPEFNTTDYNYSALYDLDSNSSLDYSDFPELCVTTSNGQFRSCFMLPFYIIICLLGLGGNLLVILTFFYFKRLKTMTDVYLLNLSFADLLFALSLPFWAYNSTTKWRLGLTMCKAMYTIYKVSLYGSMFVLAFISVERYFVIAKAISAHRYRSRALFLSKVSSVGIWLMALIFSIPEMTYTAIINNTCTPYSSYSDMLHVKIEASQIALAFALPLLVMSICYSRIVQTLFQARGFERNKAIKVILAVAAVFLVCQMPYNLLLLLNTVVIAQGRSEDCNYQNTFLYVSDVAQCVAFLRCCLNPFVYAFIGVKFRHDLLKLMKDLGCMNHDCFIKFSGGRRRSSGATDTDTTTTFSP